MSIKSLKNFHDPKTAFIQEARSYGVEVQSHVSLSDKTPQKLGGVCELVCEVNDLAQLIEVVKSAVKFNISYYVVGSMYSTLPSDNGLKGLLIINKTRNIIFTPNSSQAVVDSGVTLQSLVTTAASRALGGAEYLTAVPGTLGGAIVSSVYFEDKYIWQLVKELNMLINENGEVTVKTFAVSELNPQKGELLFKDIKNSPVILSAKIQFSSLTVSEVLERIKKYRKIRSVEKVHRCYGYIFNELIGSNLTTEDKKTIFSNRNIYFEKDILIFREGVNSSAIAKTINAIDSALSNKFRQRLTYLGYWQSDGEEKTIN